MPEESYTTAPLGLLEQIRDIRTIWPSEPQNFTNWLCQPSNLSLLSETLGFGKDAFDRAQSEVGLGSGSYRADIVCNEAGKDDAYVIIENQFGKSDHDHLGKLITYASAKKAKAAVLIAQEIREDHASMLNWLNEISDEEHRFFAVEIELWRIGTSDPAPKFNVVVQPNEWSRTIGIGSTTKNATHSDTKMLQLKYWTDFENKLDQSKASFNARKPQAQNWMGHQIGHPEFGLNTCINTQAKWIRAEIYLSGERAKDRFGELEAQADEIERSFGEQLEWEQLPSRRDCRIAIYKRNTDPVDESDWNNQHEWLLRKLTRLHSTFAPLISRID